MRENKRAQEQRKEPKEPATKELATISGCFSGKTFINFSMYREKVEKKINKLQFLRK